MWSDIRLAGYRLQAIRGTSNGAVYAVGDAILRCGAPPCSDPARWDRLSITPAPGSLTLNDVWISTDNQVFAVGSDGMIIACSQPGGCVVESSGVSGRLHGVTGCGTADRVVAVGDRGMILHRTSNGIWHTPSEPWQPPHDTYSLRGVWSSACDHIYAVGRFGTIVRYDGDRWQQMPSTTTDFLHAMWGVDENDIYAVGEDGVVLHYDGALWSPVQTNTDIGFFGVWGARNAAGTSDVVIMVGDNGIVQRLLKSRALHSPAE